MRIIIMISILCSLLNLANAQISQVSPGEVISANRFNDVVEKVNKSHKTTGIEVVTGSLDGKITYEYCNTVDTDITSTNESYDTTLPAGLNPVDALNYITTYWMLSKPSFYFALSSSGNRISAGFRYRRDTGAIQAVITDDGNAGIKIGSGVVYCMEYTKP